MPRFGFAPQEKKPQIPKAKGGENDATISIPSLNSIEHLLCELPSCDLVQQSNLYSERCGSDGGAAWPLLITGTPRSATVFAQSTLRKHGMQIQDDWGGDMRDGRVSWIYAFEDKEPFGPRRSYGRKFRYVLHQVKEPLGAITSMCTEPITSEPSYFLFLKRHIPLNSSSEEPRSLSKMCLEFWVQWHTFLTNMKFPTYKIEDVTMKDIFDISELGHLYIEEPLGNSRVKSNHRRHRNTFSWQDIYTIDPILAARAFELAHLYGYRYPDVDFDSLKCSEWMPECEGAPRTRPQNCPYGTHAFPTNMSSTTATVSLAAILGFKGWSDGGCVEHRIPWLSFEEQFVGISGLISEDDLLDINRLFDNDLFMDLNKTLVQRQLPSSDNSTNASIDGATTGAQLVYNMFFQRDLAAIIAFFILLRIRRRCSKLF